MSNSGDQTLPQAFLAEPSSLEVLDKTTFKAKGTECPICYSDAETDTVKTTCGHIFHRECLQTWLRSLGGRSGTCPSCRAVLYEGIGFSDDERRARIAQATERLARAEEGAERAREQVRQLERRAEAAQESLRQAERQMEIMRRLRVEEETAD